MTNDQVTLAKQMISDGAIIVDVRTPGEFSKSHLKSAINIPVQELRQRLPELEYARSKKVVVYCLSGQRSEFAKEFLIQSGFKDVVNGGSINDLL